MAGRSNAIFDANKAYSPLSISKDKTALLLMDYHNLTMSFAGDQSSHVLAQATKLRDWALAQDIAVYHCLVDLSSGARPEPHMKMAERWPFYLEKIQKSPELALEVAELASAGLHDREQTVSRQPGYVSALESQGLREALQSRSIKSLILAGISTSGCVNSTSRAAADQGFVVTIVEDACFDPIAELHELLITKALPATAHVASFADLCKAFG